MVVGLGGRSFKPAITRVWNKMIITELQISLLCSMPPSYGHWLPWPLLPWLGRKYDSACKIYFNVLLRPVARFAKWAVQTVSHPMLLACLLPDVRSIYMPLNVTLLGPRKEKSLAEHVTRVAEKRYTHRILAGKSKRKRSVWRPRHR